MSPSCPDWNADDPSDAPRITANAAALGGEIERAARTRPLPTAELAFEWHRRLYDGVDVPNDDYVGNIRDSDRRHPCLIDYEVVVGSAPGVPAADVPAALDTFVSAVRRVAAVLDNVIPAGSVPTGRREIQAVIRLSAYAHGEWIRIHPFANGNGRTARLWANWIAVRYGLPPFVRVKPRPDDAMFSGAAARSMQGDHQATEALFVGMLNDALTRASRLPAP